jgi:DNA-binding response OmpR family regulator
MTFTRIDQVPASILIIESDPLMLTAMGAVLNSQGHKVVLARTEGIAMQSIATGQFDLILLTIEQLNSGCEFAARLRSFDQTSDVPIIFLVPELSSQWTPKLAAHGGVLSMLKPIEPDALVEMVEKSLWMPHVASSRMSAPASHYAHASDWVKLR